MEFRKAEKAVEAVQNKLSGFGLACVTDGASVMVKFGKIIDCDHQLCYAHGIHIAVCDVLYRKMDTIVEAPSAVGENANEDEVCDEFGDEGDLTKSLEMVTSDLPRSYTRNSLVAILERFLEIWPSVAKALIDCKSELSITKEELFAIQDIVSSLQPVKAGA